MADTSARNRKGRRTIRKVAAKAPSPSIVRVRNVRPGTILHLGDGRRIGFGEVAEVARPLAAALKKSGQARLLPS